MRHDQVVHFSIIKFIVYTAIIKDSMAYSNHWCYNCIINLFKCNGTASGYVHLLNILLFTMNFVIFLKLLKIGDIYVESWKWENTKTFGVKEYTNTENKYGKLNYTHLCKSNLSYNSMFSSNEVWFSIDQPTIFVK